MSGLKRKIEVRLLKRAEDYFLDQSDNIQKKFLFIFEKTELGIKGDWFKKLKGSQGIFEFRCSDHNKFYRILAFWDTDEKNTLILATSGFDKKSNKTPLKEIRKAEQLRIRYFKSKKETK